MRPRVRAYRGAVGRLLFLALLLLAYPACAGAPPPAPASAPAPSSASPARATCFVLRQLDGPLRVRTGGDTCATRVWPASTFKVPHTLIALETGARTGPDDREVWDGTDVHPDACRADQTLRTALQNSCVWYYMRTAIKIGPARMAEALAKLHYGDEKIGDGLAFWLEGPLTISADEQTDFMEGLARRTLPFSPAHMDAVDAMMVQVPGSFRRSSPVDVGITWDPSTTKIYAKSGSAGDDSGAAPNVRWFVGHLTAAGHPFAFASLVTGPGDLSNLALTQAAQGLADAKLVQRSR
jgi:beta-lactamase class D